MIRAILLFVIRVYQQYGSPLMPLGCRFYPTCSHYTAVAVERYGAWRGLRMGLRRILRCHPFSQGGFDPVPGESRVECGSLLPPVLSGRAFPCHHRPSRGQIEQQRPMNVSALHETEEWQTGREQAPALHAGCAPRFPKEPLA